MKTKEELDALKKEVSALEEKLKDLTDSELEYVNGGDIKAYPISPDPGTHGPIHR